MANQNGNAHAADLARISHTTIDKARVRRQAVPCRGLWLGGGAVMAKRLAASESGFGRARHAGKSGRAGPLWADLGDVGEACGSARVGGSDESLMCSGKDGLVRTAGRHGEFDAANADG